ncbi:MAG: fibronectin type III domain-containing protein [bacterium]
MTVKGISKARIATVLGALALGCSATVHAGTTRVWVSQSFQDFDGGTGAGVLITSTGRLVRGEAAKGQDLKGVSMVFASLEADGALYLGTGNTGEVWRLRGGGAKKLAALPGAVIVTCFAQGPPGVVYAGTLPEGKVFAIRTATGQVTQFAKLDADHIWGLVFQRRTRTLFAATGPKGKLFAVNAAGRARLYWDSKETHLQSIAEGPGGSLYVGTAPKAIVYRLLGPGRARALHDFAGNEIRALAGDAKHLYVAVNKLKPDQSYQLRFPSLFGNKGTKIKANRVKVHALRLPRLGAKQGSGGIFVLDQHGSATQLHAVKQGYFTALELVRGTLYAAEGTRGRVLSVLPDRSVATAFDVKQRQVLTLSLGGRLRAFGTGDGAAVYRLGAGAATYTSSAYDSTNVSRFGTASWRSSAQVTMHTRSGNTADPDQGWSRWQPVAGGRPLGGQQRGLVRSPPARYVQYRLTWPGGSRAVVSHVQLHFTPTNRAPQWESLTVGSASTGKTPVQKAAWITTSTTAAPTELSISWKVSDPDGDPISCRVYYRAVGDVRWKPIGNEAVTGTSLKWKTDSLPDGWYEIRVAASDGKVNSAARAYVRQRTSPPVLVDHNKPDLVGLRVAYPVVTGLARDSYSRITGIAYSIDGKTWKQIDAADGSFDQEAERFDVRLPTLKPGVYSLLIRAHDAAGNAQVVRRALRVK